MQRCLLGIKRYAFVFARTPEELGGCVIYSNSVIYRWEAFSIMWASFDRRGWQILFLFRETRLLCSSSYAVSSSAWVLTEARQKGALFWSVWSLKSGTCFARVIILSGEAILLMLCWRQAERVFNTANGLHSLCWHHNCLGSCGLFINIDESIDSQVDRQQWQCRLSEAITLVHWASLWSASLEYANCKEDC